jgi:hypothetical protein
MITAHDIGLFLLGAATGVVLVGWGVFFASRIRAAKMKLLDEPAWFDL